MRFFRSLIAVLLPASASALSYRLAFHPDLVWYTGAMAFAGMIVFGLIALSSLVALLSSAAGAGAKNPGVQDPEKEARSDSSMSAQPVELWPNFDLMRLFMCAIVMGLHFIEYQPQSFPIPRWIINPVPAFVAISGFLVLPSFERSRTWRRFAWKRICRVMPAMSASLVLVGLLFGLDTVPDTLKTWGSSGLLPAPNDRNAVLWSLSVEEWLYAALAVLFALGAYRARWPIWSWAALAGFLSPVLLRNAPFSVQRIGQVIPCFPLGSLMYMYRRTLARLPKWLWPALLVLAAILSTFGLQNPYYLQYWTMLCCVAVVGVGAFAIRLPTPKWDLSYGLYVYHLPLLFWLFPLGLRYWKIAFVDGAVALVSWVIIERPALRLKSVQRRIRGVSVAGPPGGSGGQESGIIAGSPDSRLR